VVDLSALYNSPRFNRDPNGIYAQLVYTAKAVDVKDVMVNGRWLMRERELSHLDQASLLEAAEEYARRIDIFLIEREKSVLSKLIAIGGAAEGESFEVQAKVRIADPAPVLEAMRRPEIEVLHYRHYHEFDNYFLFDDPKQGTIRYREDEYLDEKGEVNNVRYRLTLIGPAREREFPSDVLLSRSRFLAPATHSPRFYREYFKPGKEVDIEKDRLRWRVLFQGTEFFINLDQVKKPDLGYFLEVKSRTWSRNDAEHKASLVKELIEVLGIVDQASVPKDYLEMVAD